MKKKRQNHHQLDAADLGRLLDVLQRQIALHEELRTVLMEQQGAIRRYDAAALETYRQRGDLLAERIAQLEATRESLTGAGVKISQLIESLAEPAAMRLSAVAAMLRKVAGEIAAISRVNRSAVSFMLNHFASVYKILSGNNRLAGYGASGHSVENPNEAFLVDAIG